MNQNEFINTSEYKLGAMTTHALLTRFTKPIYLDLYIPDEHNTRTLMKILSDKLNGQRIIPEEVNCLKYYNEPLEFDSIRKLKGRVGKGLEEAFKFRGVEDINSPYRYESWNIIEFVFGSTFVFGREGHAGYGELLRYRDGKRKEFYEKTKNYFKNNELQEFDRIWKIIKPFVGETNKGAPLDI